MIDRIVLHVPLESSGGSSEGNWLFATPSMTDPRIHLVGEAEDIGAVLTPSSLLLDCRTFAPDLSVAEICLGVNADWSQPGKELLDEVAESFRRRGYQVGFNSPFFGSLAPRMKFRYPAVLVGVNRGLFLDGDGEMDFDRASGLREAIGALYRHLLDKRENTVQTYLDNFPLFYENKETIWRNPRFFSAETGMSLLGHTSVSLGGMLKAIDAHPELFRPGGKDPCAIAQFFGSPMSGATVNRVVNLRTGRVRTRKDGGFHARSRAVSEAMGEYPVSKQAALPLSIIVEELSGSL